jgi:hypothetical protein
MNHTPLEDPKKDAFITDRLIRKLKKQLLSDYKSIIKRTKIEINRLSGEIKEYIKTINGFEDFIIESILFIRDRDNLISSHICNLHKNRILAIKAILDRIPSWSSNLSDNPHNTSVYKYKESLLEYNTNMITSITSINKLIEGDISMVLEYIPDYIQNINIKLIDINKQKSILETLYSVALYEYKNLKTLNYPELKDVIMGVRKS